MESSNDKNQFTYLLYMLEKKILKNGTEDHCLVIAVESEFSTYTEHGF